MNINLRRSKIALAFECGLLALAMAAVETKGETPSLSYAGKIASLARQVAADDFPTAACHRDPRQGQTLCLFDPGGPFSRCYISGGSVVQRTHPGAQMGDGDPALECLISGNSPTIIALAAAYGKPRLVPLIASQDGQVAADPYISAPTGYKQYTLVFEKSVIKNSTYKVELQVIVESTSDLYSDPNTTREKTNQVILANGSKFHVMGVILTRIQFAL